MGLEHQKQASHGQVDQPNPRHHFQWYLVRHWLAIACETEIIYGEVVDMHPELAPNLEIIKQQHQQMYERLAKKEQEKKELAAAAAAATAAAPAAAPDGGATEEQLSMLHCWR